MKLYQSIADLVSKGIQPFVKAYLPPSAPGKSTFLSFDDSHPERLVFSYIHPPTGRHHTVKVEASLLTGLTIRVTGNGCEKETIAELFRAALEQEV